MANLTPFYDHFSLLVKLRHTGVPRPSLTLECEGSFGTNVHVECVPGEYDVSQRLDLYEIPAYAYSFKPSNAELNPISHLLALVGARHIVHVSRIRVKR